MHHSLLKVLPQLRVHLKLIIQSWVIRLQILSHYLQIWDHKITLMNLRLKETPTKQLRVALEKAGIQKVQLKRLQQRLLNHRFKLKKPNLHNSIQQHAFIQIAKHKLNQKRKIKIDYIIQKQLQTLKQNNQQ